MGGVPLDAGASPHARPRLFNGCSYRLHLSSDNRRDSHYWLLIGSVRGRASSRLPLGRFDSACAGGGALPVIMSTIRSSRNPRLPLRLFYGCSYRCTCPAITVVTVILRALDRVRERALGCFTAATTSECAVSHFLKKNYA